MRDRIELTCWTLLFTICLVCLGLLVSCKSYDYSRSADSIELSYLDGGGRSHSAMGGEYQLPYAQDPAWSGSGSEESSMHAVVVSWRPFSGFYDPAKSSVEATDRLYSLMANRIDEERRERAALLPFVEHSPKTEAAGTDATHASGGDSAGSPAASASLPWWKDAAILTMWAGILGGMVAGAIKYWPRKKE